MTKSRGKSGLYRPMANQLAAAWIDLAMRGGEIAMASGQTVMHRMLMMAGSDPFAMTASERREFTRMFTEKVQSSMAYGQIMAGEMMRLNQQVAMAAWSQWWSGWMAMAKLGAGGNPADVVAAQNSLVGTAARRASDATQNISVAMTRSVTQGLKPFHTRASANAKRLSRKKR